MTKNTKTQIRPLWTLGILFMKLIIRLLHYRIKAIIFLKFIFHSLKENIAMAYTTKSIILLLTSHLI